MLIILDALLLHAILIQFPFSCTSSFPVLIMATCVALVVSPTPAFQFCFERCLLCHSQVIIIFSSAQVGFTLWIVQNIYMTSWDFFFYVYATLSEGRIHVKKHFLSMLMIWFWITNEKYCFNTCSHFSFKGITTICHNLVFTWCSTCHNA